MNNFDKWGVIPASVLLGPYMPEPITSEAHSWSFKGLRLPRIRNHDFNRLLHTLPLITTYPAAALNIEPAPDWDKLWKCAGNTNTTLPKSLALTVAPEQKQSNIFFVNVWTELFTAIALYLESPVRWKGIAYLQDLAFASGSLEHLVIETSYAFFISYGQQHYTQSGSIEIIEFSNTFSLQHLISAAG
ncbi:hypothetical protein PsorP6_000240 [Peronosclerospora sorghi]|uniref:Uncharacterized protein n=1 Tax=Peronosclerospora sorghi TaxID=230839 RepID=A0ACC0WVS0_9STRA|nr:hypothetical protein PsorP6_000240 [Peronosclerospora sorghi]